MGVHERSFELGARRLLILQIFLGALVAAFFLWLDGGVAALSSVYGAAVSVVLSSLLRWGVQQALRASNSMTLLYIGAAVRFALALVFFGVGLAALDLAPLPLIIGFCVAQAAYVILMRKSPAATTRI